jgi:hypothetical protein
MGFNPMSDPYIPTATRWELERLRQESKEFAQLRKHLVENRGRYTQYGVDGRALFVTRDGLKDIVLLPFDTHQRPLFGVTVRRAIETPLGAFADVSADTEASIETREYVFEGEWFDTVERSIPIFRERSA